MADGGFLTRKLAKIEADKAKLANEPPPSPPAGGAGRGKRAGKADDDDDVDWEAVSRIDL